MNDALKNAFICVVGFFAMFLPLYLFADPGISPFYGSVSVVQATPHTTKSIEYMQEPLQETSVIDDVRAEIAEVPIIIEDYEQEEVEENQLIEQPEEAETEEVYRYEPQPINSTQQKDEYDVIAEIRDKVRASSNDQYSISQDGSTLIVDFWDAGIDADVQLALAGSLQSSAYLYGTELVYATLCKTIWDKLQTNGRDEHITVNLWDDNKEKLVFSVSDDMQETYELTKENVIANVNGYSSSNSSGTAWNAENFNTYNIPENQQTEARYVLNTSSMKVHHPECPYVAKIAPKNYDTSNLTIAELEAQGYSRCEQSAEKKWKWE